MAEITEIISKEAIKGIKDTDKAIMSTDDSLRKLLETIEKTTANLKNAGVSFKDLSNAQSQQKKNVESLSLEEKKLQQIQKQNELTTKTIIQEKVKLAEKTKQLRDEVKRENAALTEEKNSIEALNRRNKELAALRDKVNTSTKKGQAEIKKYNAEINKNNATIKANKDALAQQKIEIGGYADGITSALSQLGLIPPAATKATGGLKALSFGFKGLRAAIMSTGIGALIVALGSLVAYFQSTEEGAAKLQKILSPFKILFGNLKDAMADFGEVIVGAFENPQQAIADLWNAIKQNFINRLQATMKFVNAFGDILQGVWELDTDKIKAGTKDAGNAFIDMMTGVENSTSKSADIIGNFVKDIATETRKENEKNIEVINRQLALDKQRRAFKTEEAKLLAEIAEQRLIANDDERTALEQQTAINKAIELNKTLAEKRSAIEKEDLELMKLRASFSDSDAETLDEIADKEAEIITLTKTQADLERSLLRRKTTINNKIDAEVEKEKKLLELKKQQELVSDIEEVNDIEVDEPDGLPPEVLRDMEIVDFARKALKDKQELREIEKQDIEKAYAEGLISYKEYQEAMNVINEESTKERKITAEDAIMALSAIGDAYFQMQQSHLSALSEQLAKDKAHELEMAEGNAALQAKINQKYAKKEAELKTKQAKADKQAAIFRAVINIATAITKMFADTGPAGFVLAAITAAIGAVQLASIAAQPVPKFAKGTESTPAGSWIAGDAGRELIKTRSGQLMMANQPTMFTGLEGAKVYTNKETERLLSGAGYDSPDVMREVVDSNNRVARAIENQPIYHFETSKRRITERRGSTYKRTYLNKKLYGI